MNLFASKIVSTCPLDIQLNEEQQSPAQPFYIGTRHVERLNEWLKSWRRKKNRVTLLSGYADGEGKMTDNLGKERCSMFEAWLRHFRGLSHMLVNHDFRKPPMGSEARLRHLLGEAKEAGTILS